MSVTEAQQRWPTGTAVGKLNIVFAEGKEPRLVLDSTICGVNPRCHLPERVALPMASDIRLATHASDHHGAFVGASIDFKAAHKQVKVREADHGLLLFQHNDKLYYYRVCHFGGRFSAYWWQRVGAFLLRQVHHILSLMPHKAWLYVDDLLAALWRPSAMDGLALLIIFMQVINAPISWKKAQCQACITWCGWDVNFDYDTIQLTKGKISKLQEQIAELLSQPKACRKLLERTIGLLVWATSISLHLRPYLAPLYSDLNSPPGSQYAIPAPIWQIFHSSLTDQLQLHTCPVGLYIPTGSKILEYRGYRKSQPQPRLNSSEPQTPRQHTPVYAGKVLKASTACTNPCSLSRKTHVHAQSPQLPGGGRRLCRRVDRRHRRVGNHPYSRSLVRGDVGSYGDPPRMAFPDKRCPSLHRQFRDFSPICPPAMHTPHYRPRAPPGPSPYWD